MRIHFHLMQTDDRSGAYWTPMRQEATENGVIPKSVDRQAMDLIDSLGYPPDTDGWVDPPTDGGWYNHESISPMIFDLAIRGHDVTFHHRDGMEK